MYSTKDYPSDGDSSSALRARIQRRTRSSDLSANPVKVIITLSNNYVWLTSGHAVRTARDSGSDRSSSLENKRQFI